MLRRLIVALGTMVTEADTCRKFVVPKLQTAGWDSDPYSIAEQCCFTDGRIVVCGNKADRKKGKRADCLLRYAQDFPIAVPDVLKLPPIFHHGNVNEIICKFGGADQLRTTVNQLQSPLYAP